MKGLSNKLSYDSPKFQKLYNKRDFKFAIKRGQRLLADFAEPEQPKGT